MPHVEQQNRIVCCAGRKGAGKSTKAREILERCSRLFIYDTVGEHRWIPDRHTDLDKAIMYLLETPYFETFMGSLVPESDDESEDFAEVCSVVFDVGNMVFAVEEVVMLDCSANFAPKKFKRVVRLGRHQNIDLFYTTQRLGECPRSLTSQTDIFILFAQAEPIDLDAISRRCGPDVARKVAAFSGHEFLIYDINAKCEIAMEDVLRQMDVARHGVSS